MKIGVATTLAFIGGALAGAGATYYLVVKPERKRNEEEVKDIVDYYHKKNDRLNKIEKKQKEIKAEGEMIRETQEKLKKLITPYNTFSDENEKEEYLATLESPKEDPEVYDISANDFINGALTYDKVSLRVFIEDGTVIDENDEPVIADDMIGIDNLNRILDGEENELYLRDENNEVDYEIDVLNGSYSSFTGEI